MEESQIYRITYEAFSKFSNSLISCRTFEEVAASLKVNLKYLFNFHVLRVSYHWGDYFIYSTINATQATLQVLESEDYLQHEQLLLQQNRPLHWTDTSSLNLSQQYLFPDEEKTELWGWVFHNAGRQIVVSLLSGKSKTFTNRDVTFVKLMAESLGAKLLELCLFQALDRQNEIISTINQRQQEVIKQRTEEIAQKNKRLIDISILNAHQVREPLSRILGLMQLIDYCKSDKELREQILPRLKQSTKDLDLTLREVIDKATEEIKELKVD